MTVVHFTAKVRDPKTLEIPEEAQHLELRCGEEVHVFLDRPTQESEALSDAEMQERFRVLTAQLFAEADAVERQPGHFSNAQNAQLSEAIAAKYRKIGLDV